jgi:hypothetical protein
MERPGHLLQIGTGLFVLSGGSTGSTLNDALLKEAVNLMIDFSDVSYRYVIDLLGLNAVSKIPKQYQSVFAIGHLVEPGSSFITHFRPHGQATF